jgi:phospholipase/carboxylesterase
MQHELTLVHSLSKPRSPSSGPAPLLLLLHGRGDNEAGLLGLAGELDGRFLCVSARAPHEIARGAFVWYHLQFDPRDPLAPNEEAMASLALLATFIDELVEAYGVDARRVFVMGFSQGAIMGLGLALAHPEKLSGLVAMSGRILPEAPARAEAERLRGFPIFIAHGIYDEVLPIELGRSARETLSAFPVSLDYREYPMGHEIGEESLGDISAWLSARLRASG